MGVSNTADTLNFINDMSKFDKEEIGGMIFVSLAVLFAMGLGILGYNIFYKDNISSPVEEMYHRQLVVTLDSILDARFGPCCCKEVIDSNDNVSVPYTRFGDILSPTD